MHGLGGPLQRHPAAAETPVAFQRDAIAQPAGALLPQPAQRELQQRERGRIALHVAQQAIDHAFLEDQADAMRGIFDELAQFRRIERHVNRGVGEVAGDFVDGKKARDGVVIDHHGHEIPRRQKRRECRAENVRILLGRELEKVAQLIDPQDRVASAGGCLFRERRRIDAEILDQLILLGATGWREQARQTAERIGGRRDDSERPQRSALSRRRRGQAGRGDIWPDNLAQKE